MVSPDPGRAEGKVPSGCSLKGGYKDDRVRLLSQSVLSPEHLECADYLVPPLQETPSKNRGHHFR